MKYYCYADTGKPAPSTETPQPGTIEVPLAAVNLYQVWNGNQWTGSEKTLAERYGDFRVAMLSSTGWGRIKQIVANSAPEFLATVAYMDENPGMVKYVWNQIISGLPITHKPTPEEVAEWWNIVVATEIGIEWIGDRDDAFDFDEWGIML